MIHEMFFYASESDDRRSPQLNVGAFWVESWGIDDNYLLTVFLFHIISQGSTSGFSFYVFVIDCAFVNQSPTIWWWSWLSGDDLMIHLIIYNWKLINCNILDLYE